MGFLSSEFLSKYSNLEPRNAGVLFYPVYLRTYSRWLPDKQRREQWNETVARVVEHSMGLYNTDWENKVADYRFTQASLVREAEEIYDRIFHLDLLPSGRALWIGGTSAGDKFGEANFNCSYSTIDSIDLFGDMFQLLLCGCGTGFRVLDEDAEKLPSFTPNIFVDNKKYFTLYPSKKEEETLLTRDYVMDNEEYINIVIGDSRQGWVQALRKFLEYSISDGGKNKYFALNYDYIRPKNARINGFGGRAPGPEGLMEMFENIAKVINSAPLQQDGSRKLTPVNCMDIMNYIGKNVIVGGTRRSSQIALGSPDNTDFLDAKKDLWTKKENLQRAMSNNSVVFSEDPTEDQIRGIFENIKNNGEPGFFNLKAALQRRPEAAGTNPCAEILLANKGFCNLATINLMAFVRPNKDKACGYSFELFEAMRAIQLATRISMRATNITVSLPEWDKVQKEERLLGVSMTGIMDAFNALGLDTESPEADIILKSLRRSANIEADIYCKELGIPRPLLVTCLKPEGTLSQLPTVSSGLHDAYAPFFIRRIRVSSMDPVCVALQKLGVPHEPDQGKAERMVFSFPIKTTSKYAASDVPALKQFQRYLTMMDKYVDHNASCTLTIGEEEWEGIEKEVYDNFDKVVACAFLPKHTTAFPQMPYEEISEDQYNAMIKEFPNLDSLPDLVNELERQEFEEVEAEEADPNCAGGVCPVR